MAEYVKVMLGMKRMCDGRGICEGCALDGFCDFTPQEMDETTLKQIEGIVLAWAEDHPEKHYPTWGEWWRTTFPEAYALGARPCPYCFGAKAKDECRARQCDECRAQEMPEDFARRLGVKEVDKK